MQDILRGGLKNIWMRLRNMLNEEDLSWLALHNAEVWGDEWEKAQALYCIKHERADRICSRIRELIAVKLRNSTFHAQSDEEKRRPLRKIDLFDLATLLSINATDSTPKSTLINLILKEVSKEK